MPQFDFELRPLAEATAAVNAGLLLVVMLETPQAIGNAEAIAAVPGIDALHVGANDLCMEMGIPGDFLHRDVERGVRDSHRRLPQARQVARHGRYLTEASWSLQICRHGRAHGPGRERPHLMAAGAARAAFVRAAADAV